MRNSHLAEYSRHTILAQAKICVNRLLKKYLRTYNPTNLECNTAKTDNSTAQPAHTPPKTSHQNQI